MPPGADHGLPPRARAAVRHESSTPARRTGKTGMITRAVSLSKSRGFTIKPIWMILQLTLQAVLGSGSIFKQTRRF